MKAVTREDIEALTDEEREYVFAKADYERLGMANTYGLNAIESMKLERAYRKAEDRYFKLRF